MASIGEWAETVQLPLSHGGRKLLEQATELRDLFACIDLVSRWDQV